MRIYGKQTQAFRRLLLLFHSTFLICSGNAPQYFRIPILFTNGLKMKQTNETNWTNKQTNQQPLYPTLLRENEKTATKNQKNQMMCNDIV